jgi:hypothetical protein
MKIEYLASGGTECPLIRLYDFDLDDAVRLKEIIGALVVGELDQVALQKQNWIVPVNGCAVTLRFSSLRDSVRKLGEGHFEFAGSRNSWLRVSGLLDPFCEPGQPSGFQWLRTDKELSLLISVDGKW